MLAPLGRDTQKRACTPVEIDRGKQVGLRAVVFTIEAAVTTAVFLEQVHDIEVGVGAVPHQPQIPPPAIAGHAGVAGARAQAGEAVLEGQIGHDTVVVAGAREHRPVVHDAQAAQNAGQEAELLRIV
jgi:hypothetical protein